MALSALWAFPSQTSIDTASHATMGSYFTMTADMTIDAIAITLSAASSSDVYSAFVATVDASQNITGTVATAASSFTTGATGFLNHVFSISSTLLSSGSRYVVAGVITSGSSTTAARLCQAGSSPPFSGFPTSGATLLAPFSSTGQVWYNQNSASPSSVTKAGSSSTFLYATGLRSPDVAGATGAPLSRIRTGM